MIVLDERGIKYIIPNNPKIRYRPRTWKVKSTGYKSKQKDLEIDSNSVGNDMNYWKFVASEIEKFNLERGCKR